MEGVGQAKKSLTDWQEEQIIENVEDKNLTL